LALALVAVVVATVGVNRLMLTVCHIPTAAMEPTLHVNDRVLVDREIFRLTGLHHGDLVMLTLPDPSSTGSSTAVKRLIGLAGDRVECREGRVYRNGAVVAEPYLANGATDCTPLTVPGGAVYVLGDDRAASLDSRHYGPVAQHCVSGRVLATV
jgi:signal peptidase I